MCYSGHCALQIAYGATGRTDRDGMKSSRVLPIAWHDNSVTGCCGAESDVEQHPTTSFAFQSMTIHGVSYSGGSRDISQVSSPSSREMSNNSISSRVDEALIDAAVEERNSFATAHRGGSMIRRFLTSVFSSSNGIGAVVFPAVNYCHGAA
ncbi:putative proteophosphoglycan ppg4, related protein [Toxoplasma gondii p89]|uniref:Putative proteophosphoglycan ppg4, related protein n=1 Tax=Toxoplasma gondii p89 TaxID=943119 RepID=A0A086KL94_TOXGO|nr:putative proteophosphoglycan ppg4, related protein [Toxoplasma gondii p89]